MDSPLTFPGCWICMPLIVLAVYPDAQGTLWLIFSISGVNPTLSGSVDTVYSTKQEKPKGMEI